MKKIDTSFNGGFPLEQDTLGFLQDRDKNILMAVAMLGVPSGYTNPVVMSGCEYDSGTGAWGDGWIFYNGDIIYFVGGVPPGGDRHIKVIAYNTTIVYEDASTHNAYTNNQFEYGTTGTTFDILNLPRFRDEFSLKSAETNYTHNVVNITNLGGLGVGVSGDIYYRKHFMPRMLEINGSLTVTTAGSLPSTPTFYTIVAFTSDYTPGPDHYMLLPVDIAANYIKDVNDKDYLYAVSAKLLNSDGQLKIAFVKPIAGQTTYTVKFSLFLQR